jgi:GxxExxY protein
LNRQEAKRKGKTPSFMENKPARNQKEPSSEVDALAYKVIGVLIEVHRKLGPGFLESVYEEATCIELAKNQILYERQVRVAVTYDGKVIGEGRIDLLIEKKLILELKAVEALAPIHFMQALAYLRMTGLELALLANFNVSIMKNGIKRVVFTRS